MVNQEEEGIKGQTSNGGMAQEGSPTTSPEGRIPDPSAKAGRNRLFRILSNKYLLAFLIILVWVLFFDGNNLISRFRILSEIRQLRQQKKYYREEIRINEDIRDALLHDIDQVEKFGRETYLMKRDNEDIYLIIEEEEAPR